MILRRTNSIVAWHLWSLLRARTGTRARYDSPEAGGQVRSVMGVYRSKSVLAVQAHAWHERHVDPAVAAGQDVQYHAERWIGQVDVAVEAYIWYIV